MYLAWRLETAATLLFVNLEGLVGLACGPGVEGLRVDHFHGADHVAVAFAAELSADDIGFECFDRSEPHGDFAAGNGVLLDAHGHDRVVVDDILAADVEDGGAVHRDFENRAGEIVPCVRVFEVDAEIVGAGDERGVDAAKFAIVAGVVVGPAELPADDAGADRIEVLHFLPAIGALGPEWEGEAEEEDGFDDDHADFEVGREVAFDAVVGGLGVVAVPEAHDAVEEEERPTDEEREHEPVDHIDHVVDLSSVGGEVFRNAKKFRGAHGWEVGSCVEGNWKLARAQSAFVVIVERGIEVFFFAACDAEHEKCDRAEHGEDDDEQEEDRPSGSVAAAFDHRDAAG